MPDTAQCQFLEVWPILYYSQGNEAEWISFDSVQPETWISRQNSTDVPALARHHG